MCGWAHRRVGLMIKFKIDMCKIQNLCMTGWPRVNAYVGSHEFASDTYPTKSLDLCAVVLPNNIAFHRREWIIKNKDED